MEIRNATQADLTFIAGANAALAVETEGQTLDSALWSQSVYALPSHRGDGAFRALLGHLTELARVDSRI